LKNLILASVLLISALISGCSSQGKPVNGSSADWAFRFVVWNNDIYTILKEDVAPKEIGKQVGKVKKYSDREGTYSNGFSNIYPVGTKLFSISGVDSADYIAVEVKDGEYIKAKNGGKYGK